MPINSGQLAYFTSLTTQQLQEMITQSGGTRRTFASAVHRELINPTRPVYIFSYSAVTLAGEDLEIQVTYDSTADTITAVVI